MALTTVGCSDAAAAADDDDDDNDDDALNAVSFRVANKYIRSVRTRSSSMLYACWLLNQRHQLQRTSAIQITYKIDSNIYTRG